MSAHVKGVYAHLDCLVDGIAALKKAGMRSRMTVSAPLPRHEILELMYENKPSPVMWFTLCGALFGGMFGFTLASLTALNWPMIIPAGKPLVAIPAYTVIVFESTVLWGCLANLLGMVTFCRLPSFGLPEPLCDVRFSNDCFGIVVDDVTGDDATRVAAIMNETGAIEVDGGGSAAREAAHA